MNESLNGGYKGVAKNFYTEVGNAREILATPPKGQITPIFGCSTAIVAM